MKKFDKNNKIKTPLRDKLLRIFSFVILSLSAVALLFPIYWMVSSATKDEAQISASDKADFSFAIKDNYTLNIKTQSVLDEYEYEDFKEDSTMMIWSIFGKYKNSNIGNINVNWVLDDVVVARTSLRELDFRINYVNIFPGEINPATIQLNYEAVFELMDSLDCFKNNLKETFKNNFEQKELSSSIKEFINTLEVKSRSGSTKSAFEIENICDSVAYKKYWKGIFDNFEYAFKYFEIHENVSIWRIFANTTIISIVAVLFQWVLSAAAAFAVAKILPKKLGDLVTIFFIVTMMIPSIVYIVPLYKTAAENNLLNNLLTVIVPGIPNATAFILFKGFFASLPDDLYEASKIDGANSFQTYFKVYVPLTLPMFGVIALLVFLGNWNDLLWPSMVLKETEFQTFSIVINRLLGTVSTGVGAGYPVTLALSALSIIPTVIVFIIFEKQLVKGIAFGGIK